MGLNAQAIGRKILQARLAKGLTQAQLAKALGVDRGTVGRWETGQAIPRQIRIPKVAEFLGQAPDALLAGSEIVDTAAQNQDVLRAERATLKEIRQEVKKLAQSKDRPSTIASAPIAAVVEAARPTDRMLSDIVDAWENAKPAARLVAALLVTEDWSYRLKLWNQEISVDEDVIKTLRKVL